MVTLNKETDLKKNYVISFDDYKYKQEEWRKKVITEFCN